jgi:3-methyladenine DNA glycosylase AlkD
MDDVVVRLRAELEECASHVPPEQKATLEGFFKEEVHLIGLKTSQTTAIGKAYLKELKAREATKDQILDLCEELWTTNIQEEWRIACLWSESQNKNCEVSDFERFEFWVNSYVHDWAACDTLCNHTVGDLVTKYPNLVQRLHGWTTSSNRWVRRASAVTLIVPAKRGLFFEDVLRISDSLLTDPDDLVQKGYGWLLKSAAATREDDVFAYVLANKTQMPRTALRYAIEKMPRERKQLAMAK